MQTYHALGFLSKLTCSEADFETWIQKHIEQARTCNITEMKKYISDDKGEYYFSYIFPKDALKEVQNFLNTDYAFAQLPGQSPVVVGIGEPTRWIGWVDEDTVFVEQDNSNRFQMKLDFLEKIEMEKLI